MCRCASRGALWEGGEAVWEVALVPRQVSHPSLPPWSPGRCCSCLWWAIFGPVLATPVEPPREAKFPIRCGACKYLSMPASSAGVERVFSAAGRMHDDLRKSAKDNTLEHSLFAAFNTDLGTRCGGLAGSGLRDALWRGPGGVSR